MNNRRLLFNLALVFLTGLSFKSSNPLSMEISIQHRQPLAAVPSASGLEAWEDRFFAVSDDSPGLYNIDRKGNLTGFIPLQPGPLSAGQRQAKPVKLDLEAITTFDAAGKKGLLAFGSGSVSPQRDTCFWINPATGKINYHRSMRPMYNKALKISELNPKSFNLEAATVVGNTLLLFNRGLTNQDNIIISLPLKDALAYLEGAESDFGGLRVLSFPLPEMEGAANPGLAAAGTVEGTDLVFVSATVEYTDNTYDDGVIGGSCLGLMEWKAGQPRLLHFAPILEKDKWIPLKIEGLLVRRTHKGGCYDLALVADQDSGTSELLEVRVTTK